MESRRRDAMERTHPPPLPGSDQGTGPALCAERQGIAYNSALAMHSSYDTISASVSTNSGRTTTRFMPASNSDMISARLGS